MSIINLWQQCLQSLKQQLPEPQYQRWIAPLTVGEDDNGNWVVYAHNMFMLNHIRTCLWTQIQNTILNQATQQPSANIILKIGHGTPTTQTKEILPATPTTTKTITAPSPVATNIPPHITTTKDSSNQSKKNIRPDSAQSIIAKRLQETQTIDHKNTSHNKKSSTPKKIEPTSTKDEQQSKRYAETNLNPEHTFTTLVEGKGNRLPLAAAISIAEEPGNPMYNPFFVYGSTGLGKTHLVQAIGNQLFQSQEKKHICYIHADEFIRGIMNAFHAKSFDAMRHQYQHVDLLIMDDVQFIAGKDRTMEEFFYLYNHLIDEKKQVILTCDTLPIHIDGMDDRLKSRFSWGLSLELEPPELEMRVAILQKKAELAHVQLQEDAAFFIAKHIRSNVRELEGAFKRVAAQSRFAKRPIDVGLATEALQDILAVNHKPITLEHIQSVVAKYYGINISDMIGKKRTQNLVRPRQIAMTLAKELTNLSLPNIGQGFGGRDHTTVMHSVKSVAKLRKDNAEIAKAYDTLIMILRD